MNYHIYSSFETTDDAEAASLYLRSHYPSIGDTNVITKNPQSLPLDQEKRTRFTLIPTAVLSQNYITGLVETELDGHEILEPFCRQNAILHVVCPANDIHQASETITSLGGSKTRFTEKNINI